MEKYAWTAKVVKGKEAEYEKRHAEIWEKMKAVLKSAGIKNYTIWRSRDTLFGYYGCEKGIEYAAKIQRESETVSRWNEYMKDVLIMETDPKTGVQPQLKKVFELD